MFEASNNYADFSGRASRSEFWLFQLLNILVVLGATALIVIREGGTWDPNYGPDPVNRWRSGVSLA